MGQRDGVTGGRAGSLLVLPFTNVTVAGADDWIGAGIAETVIADASQQSGLSTVTRHESADVAGPSGWSGDA